MLDVSSEENRMGMMVDTVGDVRCSIWGIVWLYKKYTRIHRKDTHVTPHPWFSFPKLAGVKFWRPLTPLHPSPPLNSGILPLLRVSKLYFDPTILRSYRSFLSLSLSLCSFVFLLTLPPHSPWSLHLARFVESLHYPPSPLPRYSFILAWINPSFRLAFPFFSVSPHPTTSPSCSSFFCFCAIFLLPTLSNDLFFFAVLVKSHVTPAPSHLVQLCGGMWQHRLSQTSVFGMTWL